LKRWKYYASGSRARYRSKILYLGLVVPLRREFLALYDVVLSLTFLAQDTGCIDCDNLGLVGDCVPWLETDTKYDIITEDKSTNMDENLFIASIMAPMY
jgi:hypothetical protein